MKERCSKEGKCKLGQNTPSPTLTPTKEKPHDQTKRKNKVTNKVYTRVRKIGQFKTNKRWIIENFQSN